VIKISVKSDIDKALKRLAEIEKKQVPFATAKALTETAREIQREMPKQVEKDLDQPIGFTKRGFYVVSAKKSDLKAIVGIKDIQAGYLGLQVSGGTARPRKRALLSPAGVNLNKYGNMARNKVKQLLARPDVFSGTVRGIAGIWQYQGKAGKPGRKLKLLIRYKDQQEYRPRFKFYDAAEAIARASFRRNFDTALSAALRTAR
jgi:hypothetical protein